MKLTERFLSGLSGDWSQAIVLFGLSVLTLLFSMIVASRFAGGIDFGDYRTVTLKGAGLILVVTLINLVDCGVLLAGPVWYFGLMGLFQLERAQTRTLTQVNWGMNLVWKVLLLLNRL